jgi:hypothetical protein
MRRPWAKCGERDGVPRAVANFGSCHPTGANRGAGRRVADWSPGKQHWRDAFLGVSTWPWGCTIQRDEWGSLVHIP